MCIKYRNFSWTVAEVAFKNQEKTFFNYNTLLGIVIPCPWEGDNVWVWYSCLHIIQSVYNVMSLNFCHYWSLETDKVRHFFCGQSITLNKNQNNKTKREDKCDFPFLSMCTQLSSIKMLIPFPLRLFNLRQRQLEILLVFDVQINKCGLRYTVNLRRTTVCTLSLKKFLL